MTTLLRLEGLSVQADGKTLLEPLSLSLAAGECLTILGETGAGKSLLMHAIMGTLPPPLTASGRILLGDLDLGRLDRHAREQLWGQQLGMLPQEPWHALDPLMPALQQVAEVHECVHGLPPEQARQAARSALAKVDLAQAGARLPGQLSGGMAQRVAFSAATAAGAPILLADEPTKGLDASRRDQVAGLLRQHAEHGALLTITHDVEVARQLGGTLLVMRAGQLLEAGDAQSILAAPQHDYTRALIAADPRHWPTPLVAAVTGAPASEPVLQAQGLRLQRGGRQLFEGLDLRIEPGEIIGIAGDSGCGKSSLGDVLLGLLQADGGMVTRRAGVAAHRYLKLYQDPPAAFAAGVPLRRLFDDVLRLHRLDPATLPPLLERLRLRPELLARPATEVSGGELQRLAIARALLLDPVVLFADEPVSRLDPITARDVTELLVQSARERGCALLLVSHDAEALGRACDRHIRLG